MRVWDLAAGYLNRGSLLGEHRELHGLRSILVNGKKGYSRHPETLRWVGCLSGLDLRHGLLAAEMRLRGYVDHTPVGAASRSLRWPDTYVTEPGDQISLLRKKYVGKASGRIPLPRRTSDLWAHHKYSVLARDPDEYRRIGRWAASKAAALHERALAKELVEILRVPPSKGRLSNALEHMWGYVTKEATAEEARSSTESPARLLKMVVQIASRLQEPYLMNSTALSELEAFLSAA